MAINLNASDKNLLIGCISSVGERKLVEALESFKNNETNNSDSELDFAKSTMEDSRMEMTAIDFIIANDSIFYNEDEDPRLDCNETFIVVKDSITAFIEHEENFEGGLMYSTIDMLEKVVHLRKILEEMHVELEEKELTHLL
jgi:hypothetical protein